MNAGKQAIWIFLVLIMLASTSWYFASSKPITKLDQKILSTLPDAIINELTVRQYNKDGVLVHFIQATHLKHIPLNNTNELKTPHIIIAQVNKPAWDIQSQQAKTLNGNEEVIFTKNVIIHQPSDSHTTESTIKTEQLHYFPKNKLASTDQKVMLEQPGNVIESKGMIANLADKHLQLLGQAKGIYVPKQQG